MVAAIVGQAGQPWVRCSVPDIDPASGLVDGGRVARLLQSYRRDRRLMGALTFGMNAILRQGVGLSLHCGQAGYGRWGPWA